MAKSPLILNTENPVTSSRIKYAHTLAHTTHMNTQSLPTCKRFLTKTQVPSSPVEKAAGPLRRGSPVPPPPAQRRQRRGRGRGGTTRKCNVLSLNHKKNKPGRGKGKRYPPGRGNGDEQKQRAALSLVPSDTRKSGRWSPRDGCRPRGRGKQPVPSAGTPSAARPQRSAPGQAGGGDPRARPGQRGRVSAGRRAGGRTERNRAAPPPLPPVSSSASRPGCLAPRCSDPRWRSAGFGKGVPSLRVFMPLCPEGTPPPEMLFPHSLRPSRRWPRRRPSQGQAAGRATWWPAEPGRRARAGRQPPAAPGAQPRPPASAAPGVGGRRKRGTMRRQPSWLAPVLGLTPAVPQPKSGEGKTAGNITWTEAESPAGRGKSRPVRTENQFGFLQLNSRGAGVKARLYPAMDGFAAPAHHTCFTATLLLLLLLSSNRHQNSAK